MTLDATNRQRVRPAVLCSCGKQSHKPIVRPGPLAVNAAAWLGSGAVLTAVYFVLYHLVAK